jgi:type III secretory pathway component EscT
MIAVAILVGLRLLPAALLLPILGGPLAPWSARLALVAAAALGLAAAQPPEVAATIAAIPGPGLVALGAKELAVGAVLALVAAVPLIAADTAGRWIGGAIHPSAATSGGHVIGLLAVVLFFGVGGHRIVVEALAGSYQSVPLTAPFDRDLAATQALGAIVALFAVAVALAAPSLVVGALVEVTIGLAARAGHLRAGAGAAAGLRGAAVVAFLAASLLLLADALD